MKLIGLIIFLIALFDIYILEYLKLKYLIYNVTNRIILYFVELILIIFGLFFINNNEFQFISSLFIMFIFITGAEIRLMYFDEKK